MRRFTVPGGSYNIAGGQYSLAAGQRAWVRTASDVGGDDTNGDEGTFVWSDSTTPQGDYFTSTGPNQFLIRATGGVGIGTSNPANALSVVGRADFSDRVGVGTANPGSVMADAMLDVADGHIALSNGYGVLASNNTGTGFGAGFDTRPDDGLDLYAGGAGRVRITPDGNVGIGTTDPTHRVQSTDTQAGTLSYPLKISNKGNTAGTAVGMLFQVDVGEPRGKGAIAYERTGSWNRGDFHILQNLDDGPDVAGLDDAVVTIKNNGRIGIGTRTPTTHLDITVAGISHAGVNIKNTDSDQRYLIQVNGTNPGDADRVGNLEIWGSGAGGNHNVFTATSNGNVGIRNQKPEHPLQVGTTFLDGNKAHVTAGGVWTNGSDRDSKRNFEQVDKKAILEQVVDLSVTKWQYKGEDDAIRHIGPVAQDFHEAFGLGGSDKHIGTLDADGVALAAIQELYEMVKGKNAEIDKLHSESARLRARLESLEAVVAKLNKSRNGGE